jgi:hypothetical protein
MVWCGGMGKVYFDVDLLCALAVAQYIALTSPMAGRRVDFALISACACTVRLQLTLGRTSCLMASRTWRQA